MRICIIRVVVWLSDCVVVHVAVCIMWLCVVACVTVCVVVCVVMRVVLCHKVRQHGSSMGPEGVQSVVVYAWL